MDTFISTSQRRRDTVSERRGRRNARDHRDANAAHLPEHIQDAFLSKIRPPAVEQVRVQLLSAILSSSVLDPGKNWIFDGSIRDLAAGGLSDRRDRDAMYLLACMRSFVESGLLTILYRQRGRPTIYRVNINTENAGL
jgi:hypothetical protein